MCLFNFDCIQNDATLFLINDLMLSAMSTIAIIFKGINFHCISSKVIYSCYCYQWL